MTSVPTDKKPRYLCVYLPRPIFLSMQETSFSSDPAKWHGCGDSLRFFPRATPSEQRRQVELGQPQLCFWFSSLKILKKMLPHWDSNLQLLVLQSDDWAKSRGWVKIPMLWKNKQGMFDIWLRASGKLAICSATVVQLSARYESEAAAPRAFS